MNIREEVGGDQRQEISPSGWEGSEARLQVLWWLCHQTAPGLSQRVLHSLGPARVMVADLAEATAHSQLFVTSRPHDHVQRHREGLASSQTAFPTQHRKCFQIPTTDFHVQERPGHDYATLLVLSLRLAGTVECFSALPTFPAKQRLLMCSEPPCTHCPSLPLSLFLLPALLADISGCQHHSSSWALD